MRSTESAVHSLKLPACFRGMSTRNIVLKQQLCGARNIHSAEYKTRQKNDKILWLQGCHAHAAGALLFYKRILRHLSWLDKFLFEPLPELMISVPPISGRIVRNIWTVNSHEYINFFRILHFHNIIILVIIQLKPYLLLGKESEKVSYYQTQYVLLLRAQF